MLIRAVLIAAASVCVSSAASAQDTPGRALGIGAGGHLYSRFPPERLSAGGALTLAIGAGRSVVALEAGATRRDGHNDWRGLVGPRIRLSDSATNRLYGHVLGGVIIRTGDAGFSAAAGLGLENRQTRRIALRLQVDAILDRHRGEANLGGRVSMWLVSK